MATVERADFEQPLALRAKTLCEAFLRTAAERPDAVALRTPRDGLTITWREYRDRVERLAAGLAALGVKRGDTVGIMLLNRPEFHLVDTAALHLGATPFSIYNTSTGEQIEHLFTNADPRVVVTEQAFVPVIAEARRRARRIVHVVVVDRDEYGALTLDELEAAGDPGFDLRRAATAVQPEDVATIIYTSGTTGPPKGVELTHANLLAQCRAVAVRLPTRVGGRAASFLPSAHIADRWGSHYYLSLMFGATVTSIPDPRTVAIHLPDARPTGFGAVPRVWEKLKAALEAKGIADPAALPEDAKAAIHARLGLDQAQWLVCGAAPCQVEVLEYFDALGLRILELWGMSETSCCVTINPPDAPRFGTCGTVVDGTELSLADDGEVLVRGPLVMAGYRNEPAMTATAIDPDGWLRTGDIGVLDDDGYLSIVDRKKEIIINSAGKNMSPANIEARLKASHPLIGHAVAIGDRRPYVVALLVLDPDAAIAFASDYGLDDASITALAQHPTVRDLLAESVQIANRKLSRVEQIKTFAVIGDDWQPGGDELTPTMKLKRRPIALKYAAQIDALYAQRRPDDTLAAI
jgi:long-subunit acyl-CoA synthetase (AMP-forming)